MTLQIAPKVIPPTSSVFFHSLTSSSILSGTPFKLSSVVHSITVSFAFSHSLSSMTSSVGRYTEEILNNLGIYNKIADKFILGKDAKEVIDLIKNDKIDCGIVYKTEAILNDNDLKIVAEAENNTEIIYSIAVLKNSSKEKMAREFIEYLYTEKSLNIFKEYGFDIID